MTTASSHPLIVVTPVYEDVEAAGRLFQELANVFGRQIFVVAVDDGSTCHPLDEGSIAASGLDGVVIRLKRNVGHQRAIAIGLCYVAEHFPDSGRIVVMDSDGEDLPSSIPALLQPLDAGNVEVAVAQRKSRVETLRFRAFYAVYQRLFKLLSGREIKFGNFMAFTPDAVRRLATMHELGIHVASCVLTSKLRITACPLDRGTRYAGKSKMNFVALALHGFRGLMVFAEDVLVRVGIACAFVATLAVMGSTAAIVLKLLSFATPGWFSIALGVLFLVFLQTGTLTLTTLMLTGVVRHGSLVPIDHQQFIDSVRHVQGTTVS